MQIDLDVLSQIFSNDPNIAFDDFEPIPLSEEWLKQLGFEKNNIYPEGWVIGFEDEPELASDRKLTYGLVGEADSKIITGRSVGIVEPRDGGTSWIGIAYDVKHVHQLQNLYFALTGEELQAQES